MNNNEVYAALCLIVLGIVVGFIGGYVLGFRNAMNIIRAGEIDEFLVEDNQVD